MRVYRVYNDMYFEFKEICKIFNIEHTNAIKIAKSKLRNGIDIFEFCNINGDLFVGYAGLHILFYNSNVDPEIFNNLMIECRQINNIVL